MINDVINVADVSIEEEKAQGDTVEFFCPMCKSMLFQLQHHEFTCVCGLKWRTPEPVCLSNSFIKPVMEVNGKVTYED